MSISADIHVHLHPFYDTARMWDGAWSRLSAAAPGGNAVLCLTEAAGCDAFAALGGGRWPTGAWRIQATADPLALIARRAADGAAMWILAGRQIVTAERLEILAIGVRPDGWDHQPAAEIVRLLADSGATALVPWAPGKWWGWRGRVLRRLLESNGPVALRLVDSSLRPAGWPEPTPMREAAAAGRAPLAGSDPLEFPGEEKRIGSYATVFDAQLDPVAPSASLMAVLRTGAPARRVGRRPSLPATALRIARHFAARRRA